MVKVLAVEPFFGGSHRAFLEGLVRHSRHEILVLSHPACFWKWRMRGAAITLADKARALDFKPDLVLASDMLSLAEFKALSGFEVPSLLYMHENQLCYPEPEKDPRDVHFGFTNITSCLAAERIAWNSRYHLESFLAALPGFLSAMPDCRPRNLPERIREKSMILYPGIDLKSIDQARETETSGPPLVVWNHRWEFDKRPEIFFQALEQVMKEGIDFRLALLGENYQVRPKVFLEAREKFCDKIVQFGYVEDRREYCRWLCQGRAAVSTAAQENFGIAAVEAAYAGAAPLWPRALSYPELLPPECGDSHLYSDYRELVLKLKTALSREEEPETVKKRRTALFRFDWSQVIGEYDRVLEETAGGGA